MTYYFWWVITAIAFIWGACIFRVAVLAVEARRGNPAVVVDEPAACGLEWDAWVDLALDHARVDDFRLWDAEVGV